MHEINVSVNYPETPDKLWGSKLINVLLVDGKWKAVVWDNYEELIYVVDATQISQWGEGEGV